MAVLTVNYRNKTSSVAFEGQPLLDELLKSNGFFIPHPCAGRGLCKKCRVTVSGAVSEPTPAEELAGSRLSCQIRLLGDATVTLNDYEDSIQITTDVLPAPDALFPMEGRLGAAVDIGTTTVALKLCELSSGRIVGEASALNPQTAISADVMGRIDAAMKGELDLLRHRILECIKSLLKKAAGVRIDEVDSLSLTGNTTMLYLLTGREPSSLARAPFEADCLFGKEERILSKKAWLSPCINAFVGADVTCAVLVSDMLSQSGTALLCDIGTNGEMVLKKGDHLFVTSTAAGPAFEGAGISCGCGSIKGAVDRVWTENGILKAHTVGEAPAVGICGSGLLDAVAAGLKLGLIDETGAMDGDTLKVCEGVELIGRDIRAVQLAKAAISAGILTLLETSGTELSEIDTLYIAGGFGSHLDPKSAAAIGMIPTELSDRVRVLGNAALSGALATLLDTRNILKLREICSRAVSVNLSGNPKFNEKYIEQMLFC